MPKRKKTKIEHQEVNAEIASKESESTAAEGIENQAAQCDDKDIQDAIEQTMQNSETQVPINSLEGALEYGSLIREMQHAYLERVAFYRTTAGGSLTIEQARKAAYHACTDKEEAIRQLDELRSYPLDCIGFADMLPLMQVAPRVAEGFWIEMKAEATREFESGHLASKAMMPVRYMRTAWNTACYLGVRASMKEEWQPRGGIELSLIDMMAQAFLQYQYWVEQTVLRSRTEPREEAYEYTRWKEQQRVKAKEMHWGQFYWEVPTISEKEAIEHAVQLADRWNRIYMRSLRNLRDLRRYSVPVTINNPQQVNIAADGGQQVNVIKED